MVERRKFVRFDTRLPVTYRVLPGPGPTLARAGAGTAAVASATKDVSGGGMCLFVAEELPAKTILLLDLSLPGREQPISASGEVVSCVRSTLHARAGTSRTIEAWIRFLQMEPDDRQAIMSYVAANLQAFPSE